MIPHELPGNIFMQPWWLDIVAPGKWKDIRIEKGGNLHARWPIVLWNEKGFTFIQMPILTQKLGPWIKQTSTKKQTVYSTERSVLKDLITKLPHFDKLSYNLNEDVINYLPFKWAGFEQKSVTSFKFKYHYEPDKIWKELKSSVRRDIRKATETLTVCESRDCNKLFRMISHTFQRQGLEPPYSEQILTDLFTEASQRERATIFEAKDINGKTHAAQLLIHDDDVTYYLAGGFDSDKAGAVSLLIWKAIEKAASLENSFDFEGSSIEPIEYFFSSFGAEPIHFHNVFKVSKKFAPIYYGKKFLQHIKS